MWTGIEVIMLWWSEGVLVMTGRILDQLREFKENIYRKIIMRLRWKKWVA